MEIITNIFLVLLTVIVGIMLLYLLIYKPYSIIKDLVKYFFKDSINRYLPFYKLSASRKKILNDYCLYYRLLNPKDQKLFEKRIQKFISMKQFIPRGGIKEVSEEMKVLIASSAIQLTFGHPSVYFEHFWRILIYSDSYYSTIHQQYHHGEVNLRGIIVLSWRSFLEGITNNTDGINLGIHEMAHALRFENAIRNQEYNFLDDTDLKEFDKLAVIEMEKINTGESDFFRKYAGENDHEFFAVAIEYFFEKPLDFKNYNPEMYRVLKNVLKQDTSELIARFNLAALQ